MEVYSCFLFVLLLSCWPGHLTYGNPINSTLTDAPTTSTTATQESCQCGMKGKDEPGSDYIVGGQATSENEHPWQVGVVWRWQVRPGRGKWRPGRGHPFCGGTLISSTHVLSAAHCFEHEKIAPYVRVLLGEHNVADREFNNVQVAEIIRHPDYNARTIDNDYAILRLAKPVSFTKKVSPACLPDDLTSTYDGTLATITGWGYLGEVWERRGKPNVLQEVDVTVMTNAKCNSDNHGDMLAVTKNMLCASAPGKGQCFGDSGGPLIAPENGRQALIGVVSWVKGCNSRFAPRQYPSVLARVTEQMDWILTNTAGTFSSTCRALN